MFLSRVTIEETELAAIFHGMSLDAKIFMFRMYANVGNGNLSKRLGRSTNSKALLNLLFRPTENQAPLVRVIAKESSYSEGHVSDAIRHSFDDSLLYVKYAPGVHREKWDNVTYTRLHEFFDECIPYKSGQDYRLLVGTQENLYERYRKKYGDAVRTRLLQTFQLLCSGRFAQFCFCHLL
jgi:hypothetical protein